MPPTTSDCLQSPTKKHNTEQKQIETKKKIKPEKGQKKREKAVKNVKRP